MPSIIKYLYLCSALVLAFINHCVQAEMDFTYSAADLFHLIRTEHRLTRALNDIGKEVGNFGEMLEIYQSTKFADFDVETIIKNPILSYKLVKRHSKDLLHFDKALAEFGTKILELQTEYDKVRTTFTKLGEKDHESAMEAIVRLRQTYNLSVDELADGRVGKLQINGSLSPADLADIGHFAKKRGMLTNAKLFLSSALENTKIPAENWTEVARTELNSILQSSIKHDREDFRVLTEMDTMFATDSLENLNKGFEHLCQIHAVKEMPTSNLKCYLDKFSNPIRRLSPLKIEVFHEDPQVLVFYDFMSAAEAEAIESASFYKLKRSMIQVYQGGSLSIEPSIIRTTSQSWIYDLNHPQFGYLSKRIESVTGYYLSGRLSAEELQVASYRPGGHYSLHTDALHEEILKDFIKPEDVFQGDRQATFMLYLNDVEMGGNTVFPMLNVSVRPVKGSAILWGNLYPDGSIARNTLHGACPVVYGIKYIATKWIRANDQMFTRHKCKSDKTTELFHLVD